MSRKRPFPQTFEDQQEKPSKKSKNFSDLQTNDRTRVENFLQNTDTTTTPVVKYTNFSPMTHDYQKYMSQYLDPNDVNLSLVSKTSMLKPDIHEKWVVFSNLPFSLKDIIYWFQTKHLIVQEAYEGNSAKILFQLGLLVNLCSARSKGMEIYNLKEEENNEQYHGKGFQLNPSQMNVLKTICAKNLASIQSNQDFYLFQLLNFNSNIHDYGVLFYEPFQGPNLYPYHFQIHSYMPMYNNLFEQTPPFQTPEEIQQENKEKKFLIAHPAFTFVYNCYVQTDYEYWTLRKTLLGIKYGYYHPQRIMIDQLFFNPFSFKNTMNLSHSIFDISEFVSLTGKPIKRLRYDYFHGKYLISDQNILNFYSTVLKENWIREYLIEINTIKNKSLLSQLLSLFNTYNVIPYLMVYQIKDWTIDYNTLTQTPFIQVVNSPDDLVNISKNLKGIEFQLPYHYSLENIKSTLHQKLQNVFPNSQWIFQTNPWNQYHILATPKSQS